MLKRNIFLTPLVDLLNDFLLVLRSDFFEMILSLASLLPTWAIASICDVACKCRKPGTDFFSKSPMNDSTGGEYSKIAVWFLIEKNLEHLARIYRKL